MKRTGFSLRIPSGEARLEVKTRACKNCRQPFVKMSGWQKYCRSVECAIAAAEEAKAKREKAEAREHRKKLADSKPVSHWEKKAEEAVNKYVRLRDFRDGCISCHLPANWDGQWHASHYRSVGAASAVRFNLWNINKACSVCNKWKSGNLAEYEPRIRAKWGNERVDWLKAQNQIVRYSVDYLKRLQRVFNKKARRQEKRNG